MHVGTATAAARAAAAEQPSSPIPRRAAWALLPTGARYHACGKFIETASLETFGMHRLSLFWGAHLAECVVGLLRSSLVRLRGRRPQGLTDGGLHARAALGMRFAAEDGGSYGGTHSAAALRQPRCSED
jgi:hypothetical protein